MKHLVITPALYTELQSYTETTADQPGAGDIITRNINEQVIGVTREEMSTLRPGMWIGSDIINYYSHLVMSRSRMQNTLPSVFITPVDFTREIITPQGTTSIETLATVISAQDLSKDIVFFSNQSQSPLLFGHILSPTQHSGVP